MVMLGSQAKDGSGSQGWWLMDVVLSFGPVMAWKVQYNIGLQIGSEEIISGLKGFRNILVKIRIAYG